MVIEVGFRSTLSAVSLGAGKYCHAGNLSLLLFAVGVYCVQVGRCNCVLVFFGCHIWPERIGRKMRRKFTGRILRNGIDKHLLEEVLKNDFPESPNSVCHQLDEKTKE